MNKDLNTPSKLSCQPAIYGGHQAWRLQSGELSLMVVRRGGRIMELNWAGEQLSFDNHRLASSAALDPQQRPSGLDWPDLLYGGDKTWVAPQADWPQGLPPLAIDASDYQCALLTETPELVELLLTSPACPETGLQISRRIRLAADAGPQLSINHRFINVSDSAVRWGLWDVDMVRAGWVLIPRGAGLVVYANEGDSTALVPARVQELGDYYLIDHTGPQVSKYGSQSPAGHNPQITGLLPSQQQPGSYLSYHKSFDLATLETDGKATGQYGNGASQETFKSVPTDPADPGNVYDYTELELEAPLIELSPGQSASVTEYRCFGRVTELPATVQDAARLLSV